MKRITELEALTPRLYRHGNREESWVVPSSVSLSGFRVPIVPEDGMSIPPAVGVTIQQILHDALALRASIEEVYDRTILAVRELGIDASDDVVHRWVHTSAMSIS